MSLRVKAIKRNRVKKIVPGNSKRRCVSNLQLSLWHLSAVVMAICASLYITVSRVYIKKKKEKILEARNVNTSRALLCHLPCPLLRS